MGLNVAHQGGVLPITLYSIPLDQSDDAFQMAI